MKKIIKTAALALIIVLTASCNDDFMERNPLDQISDGNYWQSLTDLRLFLNHFYNQGSFFPNMTGFGTIGIYGLDADNGSDIQIRLTPSGRMNGEGIVPASGGGWAASDWSLLRQINHFMDHYYRVAANTSDEAVQPFVGEALFFRSLFYFNMLRRFGDLPWASTSLTPNCELLFGSRLPRHQVVDSIMQDMDRAVAYLPVRGTGNWTGRLNREAALALQARIALFEGTWQKYHAGTPFAPYSGHSERFLEKAAEAAGALITLSETNGRPALFGVGVPNGYRDLFIQADYSNISEVIFWRRHVVGVNGHSWSRTAADGAERGVTKSMINSYLLLDGTPAAPGTDDATLVALASTRDARLAQSIFINDGEHYRWRLATPAQYFTAPRLEGAAETLNNTGFQLYKGHNFNFAGMRAAGGGNEGTILFRFGEVLLIYAEAKAELGTLTQACLDRSINKLRDRVGMPHLRLDVASDPHFEFASLPPIIQAIRRERKVELAFEGFRVDDIFRWAAADELIVGVTPLGARIEQWEDFTFPAWDSGRQATFDAAVAALSYKEIDGRRYIKPFGSRLNGGLEGFRFRVDRDYLLPLPTNQLVLNPNLEQNPGW